MTRILFLAALALSGKTKTKPTKTTKHDPTAEIQKDPETARKLISSVATVLDVRTP